MAHQMPMETQQELRRMPGNNRCVDCEAPYPQWATVSYGTFMCLECSGRHRGLGVHISFVRSVTMDSWTDKQVQQMQKGGNDTFRQALAAAGVPSDLSISEKYNTPQAETYRERLTAIVDGRSPPSLPQWDPSCRKPASSSFSSASYSGGGSAGGDTRGVEALKGESEQDYVARQLQLREEARARMAAKFGPNGMQGIGSGGESRAPASASSGGLGDLSGAFSYLTTTVSSAATSAASLVKDRDLGSRVTSGWSYVQSTISDPALSQNVKYSASTGWSALSSGASAAWQTAQSVVDSTVGTANGTSSSSNNGSMAGFPRTNGELYPTGKYSGMGSDSMTTSTSSRDHDNDSWLDSQLGSSHKSASSLGSQSQQHKPAASQPTLFGSSSSSVASSTSNGASNGNSSSHDLLGLSSSSVSSATSTTAPPPAPEKKEPKKDVDFFGEFGF